MAAPTPTVRQIPTGTKSPNGFPVHVTFSQNPAMWIWEKAVKPPSPDGGEAIDTSTDFNVAWRTKAPRALKTMMPVTIKAAYDATVWPQLMTNINLEQTITHTYPDGSTLCYYGFLQKAEYEETGEDGKQPEVTLTVIPTMWDPVNQVEAGPVFASAHGT